MRVRTLKEHRYPAHVDRMRIVGEEYEMDDLHVTVMSAMGNVEQVKERDRQTFLANGAKRYQRRDMRARE